MNLFLMRRTILMQHTSDMIYEANNATYGNQSHPSSMEKCVSRTFLKEILNEETVVPPKIRQNNPHMCFPKSISTLIVKVFDFRRMHNKIDRSSRLF